MNFYTHGLSLHKKKQTFSIFYQELSNILQTYDMLQTIIFLSHVTYQISELLNYGQRSITQKKALTFLVPEKDYIFTLPHNDVSNYRI